MLKTRRKQIVLLLIDKVLVFFSNKEQKKAKKNTKISSFQSFIHKQFYFLPGSIDINSKKERKKLQFQ